MIQSDLEEVLGWAAAEGWNPGREDACAFLQADPEGFFISRQAGRPVAAISVVNHSDAFAFLGLYIATPEARGQGLGYEIWQAGLAHAGARAVGLDGVPAQQANYERSGFVRAGRTLRYGGRLAPETGLVRAPSEAEIGAILTQDAAAQGYARPRYLRPWLEGSATRKTGVIEGAAGLSYATVRQCQSGCKIGPLYATDGASARALIAELAAGEDLFIDVPESATGLIALLEAEGFTPSFETARMIRGTAPLARPDPFASVATLELG